MKFKKLKEKRLLLQSEMEKLIASADSEDRALSEEESKRFDEIEKEIQCIDRTVETEERARKLKPVEDRSTADDGRNTEKPGQKSVHLQITSGVSWRTGLRVMRQLIQAPR